MVGASWYEAAAYAAWLMEQLSVEGYELQVWRNGQLAAFSLQPGTLVRLPTDAEWLRLAGGEKEGKQERYPWDAPGSRSVTDLETAACKKDAPGAANTYEAGLGGTSPVAMYPLGAGQPFGLWDLAGNAWEWTDSWYDKEQTVRVLRGGSWNPRQRLARPSGRDEVRTRPLAQEASAFA